MPRVRNVLHHLCVVAAARVVGFPNPLLEFSLLICSAILVLMMLCLPEQIYNYKSAIVLKSYNDTVIIYVQNTGDLINNLNNGH